MKDDVTVTGIVLIAQPVGDYDKRLVLLTKERGKITAFARGARRPGSQLLASANPFAFGEFDLFPGRSAYNVQRARISEYFRDLATDYDRACYGFYFLEVAEYYSMENADDRELLKLVYQSLRALVSGKFENELLRRTFELKVMGINGEYPDVFSCAECGAKENIAALDLVRDGCLCKSCSDRIGGIKLSSGVIYAMQFILSETIRKLYTFDLTKEALAEFSGAMDAMKRRYMPHPFKSLEVAMTAKV